MSEKHPLLTSRPTIIAVMVAGLAGVALWQAGSRAKLSQSSGPQVPSSHLSQASGHAPKEATRSAHNQPPSRRLAQAGGAASSVVKPSNSNTGGPETTANNVAGNSPLANNPTGNGAASLAQLKAQRQEQRTKALKDFLGAHGLYDSATQDVIIAQVYAQEEARRQIQQAGRKLLPVLGRKGMPPTSEAQANTALAEYEKAVRTYQDTRREAGEVLLTKVGADKNPHLKALLTVLGLCGDGPAVLPL